MRVVLVRPEFDLNVGMVARLMANFGLDDLVIVSPRAPLDGRARMFAKQPGREVLERAKVVSSLEEAVRGFSPVVGTTAVPGRFHLDAKAYPPEFFRWFATRRMALVFGSEGSGLSKEEILSCDLLLRIPSRGSLNLSHAVAIVLYVLSPGESVEGTDLSPLWPPLQRVISQLSLTNPSKVFSGIRRTIARACPDEAERNYFLLLFRRVSKLLDRLRRDGRDSRPKREGPILGK